MLRRARGLAPQAIATIPSTRPILAVGGDLKNAVALVVDGQAFVSQHVGDLDHVPARDAFDETVHDLCAMYGIREEDLLVAHDAHPEYASTAYARAMPGEHVAIQHHRAHVASVLAERGEWTREVLGVAFDGTGYGDDGTIWGGEFFTGSVRGGFTRVAHLRGAPLPGGDAAARFPVQAAAGFLFELSDVPDLAAAPFAFPARYEHARAMIAKNVRVFRTTSMGRLFDTVAALLGFTREITFEGQAAMWLEHLATTAARNGAVRLPATRRRAGLSSAAHRDSRRSRARARSRRDRARVPRRGRRCGRARARRARRRAAARGVRRRVPKPAARRVTARAARHVALDRTTSCRRTTAGSVSAKRRSPQPAIRDSARVNSVGLDDRSR